MPHSCYIQARSFTFDYNFLMVDSMSDRVTKKKSKDALPGPLTSTGSVAEEATVNEFDATAMRLKIGALCTNPPNEDVELVSTTSAGSNRLSVSIQYCVDIGYRDNLSVRITCTVISAPVESVSKFRRGFRLSTIDELGSRSLDTLSATDQTR